MPLFLFACDDCGAESEVLVRNHEAPLCPKCGSSHLKKQASAFAALSGGRQRETAPVGCGASSCCMREGGGCPYN